MSSNGLDIKHTIDGEPASTYPARKRRGKATPNAVDTMVQQDDAADDKRRKIERQSREKLRSDPFLWGIYLTLMVYSIVELYSASSSEIRGDHVFEPIKQHGIFLAIGFGLILLISNMHYKYIRKTAWIITAGSIGLVIWSTFGGIVINGAQRAISIAGFTVQPAEIAKLALVVTLVKVISKYQMPQGVTNMGMMLALGISALFCALLYGNGLTNTILIAGTAVSMLIIGGLQTRKILIIMVIGICVGGPLIYKKYLADDDAPKGTATEQVTDNIAPEEQEIDRTDLRRNRIKNFFAGISPEDKITDENRQVIFSKFAQAHGGIRGQGPGNSRENARLPLAFSDYIFSIIIEDTGLIGGLLLLLTYLSLIGAAGRIAVKCRKAFPALLIMGCAVMIVLQALGHMAIVVGIVPVSGQPLPFISKGGTSVIVMSIAMGMMLSVSKFAVRSGKNKEQTELREAVADNSETDNPTMIKSTDSGKKQDNDPLTY